MKVSLVEGALTDEWIIIGRLGAPFGVQGWIKVLSFTQPRENIFTYHPWYIKSQGQWSPIKVIASRFHGQGLVVQLEDIKDRDHAARFNQADIAVARNQLSKLAKDEFYWTDLEGLTVYSASGQCLGCVQFLYENAGMDVMVVEENNKTHHIPFLMHETVLTVDLTTRKIVVDWAFC